MKKRNITIIIIICVILSLILVILKTTRDNRFALDRIYDVLPDEVKNLYINMVNVSCNGDIHFDVKIDEGPLDINNMNKQDLLNYLFSYLDKKELLDDKLTTEIINKTEEDLFINKLDLINDIKDYQYNNYIYNINNNKIVRKYSKCIPNDKQYVAHAFGYFHDEKNISIDMNVAYVKDDNLYDYNDKLLGKYTGIKSELSKLTESTSYYRVSYTKDNGRYKLTSIEWLNRG